MVFTSKYERALNRLIDAVSCKLTCHTGHLFVLVLRKRNSPISSLHLQQDVIFFCYTQRLIWKSYLKMQIIIIKPNRGNFNPTPSSQPKCCGADAYSILFFPPRSSFLAQKEKYLRSRKRTEPWRGWKQRDRPGPPRRAAPRQRRGRLGSCSGAFAERRRADWRAQDGRRGSRGGRERPTKPLSCPR